MYDFILHIVFFGSFGVIIYLMARAVPRVSDSGETVHAPGRFDRMLARLPLQQVDDRLNRAFEKLLRKTKVLISRVDNFVNDHLKRLKKNSARAEQLDSKREIFDKLTEDKHDE